MSDPLVDAVWAGLADDLPASPRSVLQPTVEAIARGEPPPTHQPAETIEGTETELWLLGRACSAACGLALRVRPDLDRHTLARLIADSRPDDQQAALAEDIVVTLSVTSEDGTLDPTRLVRSDSRELMAGFANCTLALARIISERVGREPDQIVNLCFSAADGTFPRSR